MGLGSGCRSGNARGPSLVEAHSRSDKEKQALGRLCRQEDRFNDQRGAVSILRVNATLRKLIDRHNGIMQQLRCAWSRLSLPTSVHATIIRLIEPGCLPRCDSQAYEVGG